MKVSELPADPPWGSAIPVGRLPPTRMYRPSWVDPLDFLTELQLVRRTRLGTWRKLSARSGELSDHHSPHTASVDST